MNEPTESIDAAKNLPGLTNAVARSLVRTPIRSRESSVTLAAWRMEITCDQGHGSIVLIESAGGPIFRGDGHFLGWSQEDLSAAYAALLAPPDGPPEEILQLG